MIRRARRSDFGRFHRAASTRTTSGPFRCVSVDVPDDDVVIGYAIPRSAGNAVERNRLRRQMRAACAEIDRSHPLPSGTHLVSFGGSCRKMSYADVIRHLEALFIP